MMKAESPSNFLGFARGAFRVQATLRSRTHSKNLGFRRKREQQTEHKNGGVEAGWLCEAGDSVGIGFGIIHFAGGGRSVREIAIDEFFKQDVRELTSPLPACGRRRRKPTSNRDQVQIAMERARGSSAGDR